MPFNVLLQEQNHDLVAKLEAVRGHGPATSHRGDRDEEIEEQLFALDRQLRDKTAQITLLQVRTPANSCAAYPAQYACACGRCQCVHVVFLCLRVFRGGVTLSTHVEAEPVRANARQAGRGA